VPEGPPAIGTEASLRTTLGQTPLAELSTALLRAELAKRQNDTEFQRPACGSGSAKNATYNTSLHVAALIIILVLSTLACSFPIIVRRFPRLPVPHRFLFVSRHFGTGVLIATAFVHLLPTAFVSLTDPCLPPFWNEGYPAMPGLVAMSSVLVVVGIEMFFATRGAGHVHGGDYGTVDQEANHAPTSRGSMIGMNGLAKAKVGKSGGIRHFDQGSMGLLKDQQDDPSGGLLRTTDADAPDRSSSAQGLDGHLELNPFATDDEQESDLDLDDFDDAASPNKSTHGAKSGRRDRPSYDGNLHTNGLHADHQNHNSEAALTEAHHAEQRLLLQCLLLEAGILFHSIFIGMALSVATGTPFVVLLVAISFHQTFEGLALGSRIAAITSFGPSSPKPWLMALAYGTTTPIGQAIGLLVHKLYDPMSETGLLMVGFMNAISSGLLIFAGLVELLAEDFLSEKSYETLFGKKRLEACVAVVCGSILMALVGAWA